MPRLRGRDRLSEIEHRTQVQNQDQPIVEIGNPLDVLTAGAGKRLVGRLHGRWRNGEELARRIDEQSDAPPVALHHEEASAQVVRHLVEPEPRAEVQRRHHLTAREYDAIDEMHSYALAVDLYELRAFEDEMREMTMLIVEAAHLTAEAMPLLRDSEQRLSS